MRLGAVNISIQEEYILQNGCLIRVSGGFVCVRACVRACVRGVCVCMCACVVCACASLCARACVCLFVLQELWNGNTCLFVDRAAIRYMGYTLRVPGYARAHVAYLFVRDSYRMCVLSCTENDYDWKF